MSRTLITALLALTTSAAAETGSTTLATDRPEHSAIPVINGTAVPPGKWPDAVAVLSAQGSCTGTLLSPRLVLTARHCVADTDESAACDVKGEPIAQGAIRGNHKADTLYVFTGPNRPDFRSGEVKPDGQGLKIIDDGGKNLCNHDIALLVLAEPVKDAKISPIRLDGPIVKGEILTAIGWGVTEETAQPDVRQQRTGIKVEGIGPSETDRFPVPPNEFEVGESICSGDSGGPALAKTNAIVGVVSRGGNLTKPDPSNPASSCIGGENLYTKVEPFRDMILGAYALVEADPWYENGADPRLAKPGALCTDGTECRSNLCLFDPSSEGGAATTCAADCSIDTCGEGQTCTVEREVQVCRATPAPTTNAASSTTTTGCATAAGRTSSASWGALVLAALGLVALRRRSL